MGWRDDRRDAYLAKLRDPRWQQRRLKIFERDGWTCQLCFTRDVTLHVHHVWYEGEPWEAPAEALLTLCEPCHEQEGPARRASEQRLIATLRAKLPLAWEVDALARALTVADRALLNDVGLQALTWALSSTARLRAVWKLAAHSYDTAGELPRIPDPSSDLEDDDFAWQAMDWDGWAIPVAYDGGAAWLMTRTASFLPNGEELGGASPNDPA